MSRTGFVFHQACVEHDPGVAHPERPDRLRSIHARLRDTGLLAELAVHEPRRATEEELLLAHTPAHVELVRRACAAAPRRIDGDTAVSPGSFEAALRAAGGLLDAVERVRMGEWTNGFCAVRPPGHHAEEQRAMGFCLFNNIAVAARRLRQGGCERVAIVDWDVHHGNGTQHLFEEDPTVFYASLHQWPLYPGTGAASERGRGAGEGTTLNLPMDPGSGDLQWLGAFERELLPALEEFRPDFVLVSAGFDAHRLDPLSQVRLTEGAFREMTRLLCELAERHAGGRLVAALEGGYHLEALASSVQAHLEELKGRPACA